MTQASYVLLTIIVVFGIHQAKSQKRGGCHGWESFATHTNQVTCLWLSKEKASWINAMSWCRLMDAQLAEIGSTTFKTKITQLIQMKQTGKYWIGLSDMENERVYKWMTSKLTPQTLFFKPGLQISDRQKNCVSTDEKGEWTIESCKAEFYFVCQRIIKP